MLDLPEEFDNDVRNVVRLAQEEAHRLGVNYVGAEHLLLGLTRADEGAGARVLKELADPGRARHAVEFIVGAGGGDRVVARAGATPAPLTPRARLVFELARDEARLLGHPAVGSDHLLLGLILEGEGIPAGVLASFGVRDVESVRRRVAELHDSTESP